MPLTDEDFNRCSTYFGIWSLAQSVQISELLERLGVRYRFLVAEQSEERLKEWGAWDPASSHPREGHELFIHSDDLLKVGTRIVGLYPERAFGAGSQGAQP